MLKVICSECNKGISLPYNSIGKRVKCPKCENIFTVDPLTVPINPTSNHNLSEGDIETHSSVNKNTSVKQKKIVKPNYTLVKVLLFIALFLLALAYVFKKSGVNYKDLLPNLNLPLFQNP